MVWGAYSKSFNSKPNISETLANEISDILCHTLWRLFVAIGMLY